MNCFKNLISNISTVTFGTYLFLGIVSLIFLVDFIVNGRILEGRKFLKYEARNAYFMFFTLFGVALTLSTTIIVSANLFLKPTAEQFEIIVGAATFSSVFSGLCFAAAGATKKESSNYSYCGKRFLEATVNFFFLILIHYLFFKIAPFINSHTREECPLHSLELIFQAIIIFTEFLFLVVGISIFTHAVLKLQKEAITFPTNEP